MSAVRENQKSKRMINQKVVKQMDKAFEALIKHLSQDKIEELLKKFCLNPSFKNASFNNLAVSEWKRRIDDAIEEDLVDDVEE